MNKTRIIFFSYPEYSGNTRYLYEYIKEKYNKNYEFFWYCRHNDDEQIYIDNNLNYIKQTDETTPEIIKNADIIFDTHGIALGYDLANVIYVNLWHGVGPKKAGFLIPESEITDDDLAYSYDMFNNIDYFITPSKFWNYIHGELFNTNHHRMIDLGSPRNEALIKSKKTIKDFNKYNKIIFYLPTIMNNGNRIDISANSNNNILNLKNYDKKDLFEYLEKNNYLLVVRYHPSEKNEHLNLEHKNILNLDDKYLNNIKCELYEILNLSDVLITDYSSIYFDYLLLDKPIIFSHSTKETYSKKRGYIFDNYDFWFFGNKVDTLKSLKEALDVNSQEESLKDERKTVAEFFLGKNYFTKNKNASKNIYNFFFNEKYQLKNGISKSYSSKISERSKALLNENAKLKESNEELLKEVKNLTKKYDVLTKELENITKSKLYTLLKKILRK